MSAVNDSASAGTPPRRRLWSIGVVTLAGAVMAAHIWWYRFLCDDAYIAFRYARNLARGRGLVFNVGERVEGYTSLLWVLQLAAGYGLGVSGEVFPHLLSLAYTVGALLVLAGFIARQQNDGHRWAVILIVLVALSVHRTWAVWATSGLETRAFTFFVLLTFYTLTRATQAPAGRTRLGWLAGVSLALALATLTRPDAQIFLPFVVMFWVVSCGHNTAEVLALAAPCVVVIGGEYLWRYAYYGAWLPNTYYAKVGDAWPEMGVRYLLAFILEYGYYLILPLILLMWRRVTSPLSRRLGLLAAACMGVHAAYYCYQVGGDHFEFRIFDFYVPLIAWMAAESVVVLASRHRVWAVAVGVVMLAYSVVIPMSAAVNTGQGRGEDFIRQVYTPASQFKVTVQNTPVARWMPGMSSIIELDRQLMRELNLHLVGTRQEVHRACWLSLKEKIELAGGAVERGVLPPMTVGDGHPGVLGYYLDVEIIDLLGLTDAVVARLRVPREFRFMAHERGAPKEYLDQRHAHVHIVSATRYPLPQQTISSGPVMQRVRKSYSIRLGGGAWLNIWSGDGQWVRAYFKETPMDIVPRALNPGGG